MPVRVDNVRSVAFLDARYLRDSSYYVDQSGGTSDTYGTLGGVLDGANKVFTASEGTYVTGTLSVWLNGQLQTQGTGEDWVETTPASGTFTMTVAPEATDEITISYQKLGINIGNADTVDGIHASITATVNKLLSLGANKDFDIDTGDFTGVDFNIEGALNHDGSTIGFFSIAPTTRSTGWSVSNLSSDKAFDANSTTLNELADIVGTIMTELIAKGLIGA